MKSALTAIAIAAVVVIFIAAAPPGGGGRDRAEELKAAKANSAETYEHLATAIIEMRKTEDGLVKGIIMHSAGAADAALGMASRAQGGDKKSALERAAEEITNVANEGDKSIQAVRQRLRQAGHTHHTDAETKEDYMWIDGKEKKKLVDLAQRVSKMGEDASADDVNKARQELRETMKDAMKQE